MSCVINLYLDQSFSTSMIQTEHQLESWNTHWLSIVTASCQLLTKSLLTRSVHIRSQHVHGFDRVHIMHNNTLCCVWLVIWINYNHCWDLKASIYVEFDSISTYRTSRLLFVHILSFSLLVFIMTLTIIQKSLGLFQNVH